MTLNFNGTAVPAANIKVDTDNIVVAQLEITPQAEGIKITQFELDIEGTNFADTDIENVELYDVDTGGIIDLTLDAITAGKYGTDEEIEIAKGVTKIWYVRLDTTATAAGNEIIHVVLDSGDLTAEGLTSEATIEDWTPTTITSKNMTIVKAGLTHTTATLGDVTTIAGAQDVAVYKATLKATKASDIKITKVVFQDNDNNDLDDNDSRFDDDNVTAATLVINGEEVKTLSGKINEATGDNTLSFTGLSATVGAGETVTMYLKLSFNSTLNAAKADAFTIEVNDIEAKDEDNDNADVTVDKTAGPTITVNNSGELDVTISTTETDANRDLYVTAGTASGLLGCFKFDAQNEAVKVKKFVLMGVEDDADLADDIASVDLIDDDKSTVLATSTDFEYGDWDGDDDVDELKVTFEDWNYVVEAAGIKKVYVRVNTVGIDKSGSDPEKTGDSNVNINFTILDVEAEGNESGVELEMNGVAAPAAGNDTSEFDNDTSTNTATNVAINISGIANAMANGTLTNGQIVIGKYEIAVDANGNATASGEDAAVDLQDVVITFAYDSGDVQIGDDNNATADFYVYWASDPTTKVTVSDLASDATSYDVDLSSLADITSNDTLVIEAANIQNAGDSGDYIQTKLLDINTGDFEWSDGITATFNGVRLPYTDVAGATLSN